MLAYVFYVALLRHGAYVGPPLHSLTYGYFSLGLRCERTIQGSEHNTQTVTTRWKNKINQRIATDRYLAKHNKSKHFTRHLVQQTWSATLRIYFPDLDPDWVVKDEVLVGINPTIPCTNTG